MLFSKWPDMYSVIIQVSQYMETMDEVAVDMVKLIDYSRDEQGIVHNVNDLLFRWSMECMYVYVILYAT